MFIHGKQHSQNLKNHNKQKLVKKMESVAQKNQGCTGSNRRKDRNRVDNSEENKKKVFKRRNWLILNVQIILILVLKNLSHQNIVSYVASYILMVLLLSIMDE